jgi:hypothetical protein
MTKAGSETAPGARFAIVTGDGPHAWVLDWFPTLAGRTSIGTYQGLEWTTTEQWDATNALDDRIQQGEIPANADFVFSVKGGSASIRPAR